MHVVLRMHCILVVCLSNTWGFGHRIIKNSAFDDLDPALQKEVISKYLSETCDDDDRIRYAPNAVYEESMKWLEKESKVRDKINKGFERKE